MHQIEDGTGTGNRAKVDSSARLWTRAVAETPDHEAVVNGDHYILTSTPITLTNANKSSLIYYSHNEIPDLFIDRLIITSTEATDGTVNYFNFSGTRNPTGMADGTGTEITQVNSNFGSVKTLNSTTEKGQTDASTAGGDPILSVTLDEAKFYTINTRLELTKGNAVAFEITPPAGNTSFQVTIAFNCHLVK